MLTTWLREFDERPLRAATHVHLVVTPLGLGEAARLLDDLHELGVEVLERTTLRAWSRLSTALHVTKRSALVIERAVLFEHVWRRVAPEDCAEAWTVTRPCARVPSSQTTGSRALPEPAGRTRPTSTAPSRSTRFISPTRTTSRPLRDGCSPRTPSTEEDSPPCALGASCEIAAFEVGMAGALRAVMTSRLFIAVVWLSACGPAVELMDVPDAMTQVDAGVAVDAGIVTDAGSMASPDAGDPTDAGVDGGTPTVITKADGGTPLVATARHLPGDAGPVLQRRPVERSRGHRELLRPAEPTAVSRRRLRGPAPEVAVPAGARRHGVVGDSGESADCTAGAELRLPRVLGRSRAA